MKNAFRANWIAILFVFSLSAAVAQEGTAVSPLKEPPLLQQSIGCLVAKDFVQNVLKDLGLKPNSLAWVRFHSGLIKGFEKSPPEIQVAVYAEGGRHGRLLLAIREADGRISPVQNAYQLTRESGQWTADEGQGGIATYKAMSAFATELGKSPCYRVKLVPGNDRCGEGYSAN